MNDQILHKVDFGYLFWCPGCGHAHGVWVNERNVHTGAHWGFNGNLESPTFTPSILNRWNEGPEHKPCCCHLFVRDGKIEYLGDCTHSLAGKTVPMEAF